MNEAFAYRNNSPSLSVLNVRVLNTDETLGKVGESSTNTVPPT